MPSMDGFTWTPRINPPTALSIPGDLWCVRDSISTLMGWPPGSAEWLRFIEAPSGPADMARLIAHLGLVAYDPEYPPHIDPLKNALDRPGIAVYKFHSLRVEHCMYQPHLRHWLTLPNEYPLFDPDSELFQIIVDERQVFHEFSCSGCRPES